MMRAETRFKATFAHLDLLLKVTVRRHASFAARLGKRDLVARIRPWCSDA